MTDVLNKTWDALLGMQRWIMFISCALIIVGLFVQVLLRYVFETSLFGLSELIVIPALWMYFMGASYSAYEDNHVAANVLQVYLKRPMARAVLKLIIAVITLGLSLILTYWGWLYIVESVGSGASSSVWDYPLYLPQSAIFVGFLLMTLYSVANTVIAALALKPPER